MLTRAATLPQYRYKTIEHAEPPTDQEHEEQLLHGWRHLRTVKRTSKQGRPYWQSEYESCRPAASVIENRTAS